MPSAPDPPPKGRLETFLNGMLAAGLCALLFTIVGGHRKKRADDPIRT